MASCESLPVKCLDNSPAGLGVRGSATGRHDPRSRNLPPLRRAQVEAGNSLQECSASTEDGAAAASPAGQLVGSTSFEAPNQLLIFANKGVSGIDVAVVARPLTSSIRVLTESGPSGSA